jgi:hypothetical protein
MPLLKITVAFLVAVSLWSVLRFNDNAALSNEAMILPQAPAAVRVGDRVAPEDVHPIIHPGRYGLGPHLSGSRYGIVGGQLIRFDPTTYQVQSILRRQAQLLD